MNEDLPIDLEIPAGWDERRIVRYLRRLRREPGLYRIRFAGRITPGRIERIAARIQAELDKHTGGIIVEFNDEHDGAYRQMIQLRIDPHGPSELDSFPDWIGQARTVEVR